jgi:hypothetical protein
MLQWKAGNKIRMLLQEFISGSYCYILEHDIYKWLLVLRLFCTHLCGIVHAGAVRHQGLKKMLWILQHQNPHGGRVGAGTSNRYDKKYMGTQDAESVSYQQH